MNVEFTPAAVVQLAGIATYLRNHNPEAAVRIADTIESTAKSLGKTPLIGRRQDVEGMRRKGVSSTRYLIYYIVLPDVNVVRILAVLHGAQQRPFQDI